jgi:hypothetical protein
MAKAKKGSKENPVTTEELAAIAEPVKRPFKITEAAIKDDFCSYKYEMTEGKGPYDIHKVDGKGIIEDDMSDVFRKFRVHMAAVYGVFKLQGIEVTDIDQHHLDDITAEFHVDGFKIRGSDEMESIILIGSKHIGDLGGRMALETPKIDISDLSSYKWYNELKELANKAREEVALYKGGKYTIPEIEEEEEEKKPRKGRGKQLSIVSPEGAADEPEGGTEDELNEIGSDNDFEDARL